MIILDNIFKDFINFGKFDNIFFYCINITSKEKKNNGVLFFDTKNFKTKIFQNLANRSRKSSNNDFLMNFPL